jgi:hypothetical protein
MFPGQQVQDHGILATPVKQAAREERQTKARYRVISSFSQEKLFFIFTQTEEKDKAS